ncbi:MAG: PACE efflux transporter [Lautropia sp.]|nr:PACE efflux transporter [Lautropia sp.]
MRTPADRIRHMLLFEVTALLILIPVGVLFFGLDPTEIGVLGISTAAVAAVWNYVYNVGFDKLLKHLTGSVHKRLWVRVLHAVLFEGGLVVMLVPFIAWWLDISLWQALVADIGLVAFYVVFAFFYNLAYDRIFPIPEDTVGRKQNSVE